jgi:RNA polymerase sigma factor (TIGR02999 family)
MSDRTPGLGQEVSPQEFARVYDELRRMAHTHMLNERGGHSLQTTALVHEAYLRLCHDNRGNSSTSDGPISVNDRRLFFSAAAESMRRILIEHARARGRQKRGGDFKRISLDSIEWLAEENLDQTLMFDEAICRLEKQSPDEAQVVRLRFYAGLSIDETAEVMDVSPATVDRRWRFARAWLWRELKHALGAADAADATEPGTG